MEKKGNGEPPPSNSYAAGATPAAHQGGGLHHWAADIRANRRGTTTRQSAGICYSLAPIHSGRVLERNHFCISGARLGRCALRSIHGRSVFTYKTRPSKKAFISTDFQPLATLGTRLAFLINSRASRCVGSSCVKDRPDSWPLSLMDQLFCTQFLTISWPVRHQMSRSNSVRPPKDRPNQRSSSDGDGREKWRLISFF